MSKLMMRMGDGDLIEATEAEIRENLEIGTQDAAERGKIDPLSDDEIAYLLELYTRKDRVVGVEQGKECCLSYDNMTSKIKRAHIPISKIQQLLMFERGLGADTLELSHIDYSFKQVKHVTTYEKPNMEQAVLSTIAPIFYGAMPNLGLYTVPDGPVPNPGDLLPQGKIAEARQSYEAMIDYAVEDMVYVGSELYELGGADGINFDTTAASGDAEFYAALKAVEILRKKYPDMGIEMGMSGEFILGMHGEIEYDGVRLAGLFPHEQVKLAQKAGVTIFGPAINIVSNESLPWNVARSITFTKACSQVSEIPIHANLGMGVGGVPLVVHPPLEALSRASKAHVELCRLDGL
jgi:dimethylamine---corrinoid protein Co-methyltransferase